MKPATLSSPSIVLLSLFLPLLLFLSSFFVFLYFMNSICIIVSFFLFPLNLSKTKYIRVWIGLKPLKFKKENRRQFVLFSNLH